MQPRQAAKRQLEDPTPSADIIACKLPAPGATAGRVLKHCQQTLNKLIADHKPLIFKVGVTHNHLWRWHNDLYGYKGAIEKWTNMLVIYESKEPYSPCMLEAALIDTFQSILAIYVFSVTLFFYLCFPYKKPINQPENKEIQLVPFLSGTPGCKNIRLGGDTPPSLASETDRFATYVVYRSFKHPPPIKKIKKEA